MKKKTLRTSLHEADNERVTNIALEEWHRRARIERFKRRLIISAAIAVTIAHALTFISQL